MSAVALDFDRHVACIGCFNFRDLGGYRTADGRWTRPHRLYRADGPHALTDADIAKLAGLGLVTVIDLRTPSEVEARGCYTHVLPDLIEYHLPMLDVLPDPAELPEWVDPAVVAGRYRYMLETGRDTVAEILAVLSDPSAYPALFHCSAGKDRTGVVAAVLLGIMGVPDDAIIVDYALSGAAMHGLVEHYRAAYPHGAEQLSRLAPAMVAAHPESMAGLIDFVRRDYGSFEAYTDVIGVGSARQYIRRAMLISRSDLRGC